MIDAKYKTPAAIVAVIIVVALVYGFMTMRDNRSTGERIGDAVDQLGDRTPGQKLGDAVKDAGDKVGDKIKENTNP